MVVVLQLRRGILGEAEQRVRAQFFVFWSFYGACLKTGEFVHILWFPNGGLSGGVASKLVKSVASFLLCELVLYTATLGANFKSRCRVTFLPRVFENPFVRGMVVYSTCR